MIAIRNARRVVFAIVSSFVLIPGFAAADVVVPAKSNAAPPGRARAANALFALGPEGRALAKRAGIWDVTVTSWDGPGAAPVTVGGLVAERRMIGPMLEEMLHPASSTSGPAFTRVDELTFNRLEGRWDYMSMDSRVPDGLMSAWSLDRDPARRIFVSFAPFATTWSAPKATGQMLRMEQVIIRQDADHDRKDQYFTKADGVGTKWLAKRYSYTRHRQSS